MDTPRTHHGEPSDEPVFDREAFRTARLRAGLTLADLARDTHMSLSGMKKLQAGHRTRPQPETYRKIVWRLGLPPGSLWISTTPSTPHEVAVGGDA